MEGNEVTHATVEQLHSPADSLFTQFEHGGRSSCLEEAVMLGHQAPELRPPGYPERWASRDRLRWHLHCRYCQLGGTMDIEEANMLARRAPRNCTREHSNRSLTLHNLAVSLSDQYTRSGAADLNEAISRHQEALQLRPPGHPGRSSSLNNLVISLSDWYLRLRGMVDLNEAISLHEEALPLCPPGHLYRSLFLNNFALSLSNRYQWLGMMADFNEAINLHQEALQLRPPKHPDRSTPLKNLPNRISDWYKRLGVTVDFNEAISLDQEALQLRPSGHPDRPFPLNTLANFLSDRYNQFGAVADLNKSISQEVLQLRLLGHLDRSGTLSSLARFFQTRFQRSGDSRSGGELFSLYAGLKLTSQVVSSSALSAIKEWICAAEHFHHPTMVFAYESHLRSLIHHLTVLLPLPRQLPILKNLASSLAAYAFSAYLRNHDPTKAVELMEEGRGLFWNQLTRLRSPLDDVTTSGAPGKVLANEFTEPTSQICDIVSLPRADHHNHICRLNVCLESVSTGIRKPPGFSHFLLSSPFFDLRFTASDGPVIIIINASEYMCDALLVFVDRNPVHIPLQTTKAQVGELSLVPQSLTLDRRKMSVSRHLALILRRPWDEVIVDFLNLAVPAHSCIWWCPTAEFSFLPLHAAGPYRKGQQNLTGLSISSYTPTLTALIHARPRIPSSSMTRHVVAMGQKEATGESELGAVGTKLAITGRCLEGIATFTCVKGLESCISHVFKEPDKNKWIHLACHSLPNWQQPFELAFTLYDGHLTIKHIMRCELEITEFACLSACHTMVGDEESPDKAIHLASAMHFAGLCPVIRTTWGKNWSIGSYSCSICAE